ncbi:hypothetical protein BHE74_00028281 [Ensete ventricosum]|nr:hypothetical protein BHE74_00028281 [Ensete ventricosum]
MPAVFDPGDTKEREEAKMRRRTRFNHPSAVATTLLLVIVILPAFHAAENISYSFTSFNDSVKSSFAFRGDATIYQGALQLTPDSRNGDNLLINKSGRILLPDSIKLWDWQKSNNTKRVASFNTAFTINVFHDNGTVPGEGLTFLIAPNVDEPPPGSYGPFLGLTNASLDGNNSNHFVAIEFDTAKQPYDRDDNHVGLDINGVDSNITASLTPLGIEIAPVNPTNHTVWIDYDGVHRHVWVYMAVEGSEKPVAAVLNASIDISDYVLQSSHLGFSASTGSNFELNCVVAWNLTVEMLPDDGGGLSLGAIIGVAVGVGCVLVVMTLTTRILVVFCRRKRAAGNERDMLRKKLNGLPGTPREFEYKELKVSTGNFDERRKLGQGAFGEVYKGVLPGSSMEVAVKRFSRDKTKGQDDFLAELTIINCLRHRNLVPLLGYLDQHLYGGEGLVWWRRYNIVAGVASALHYIHHEYNQMVVHRDLKPSNIMLDATFDARLGDFGLARALDTDKTSFTELGVVGTRGYIANECCITQKFTRESDVYAFGTVVLEVVCGRRPLYDVSGFHLLVDWVWKLHREGRLLEAVDPRLGGEYPAEDAERMLLLGLACSQPHPGARPKAQAIVQIVSRSAPPPGVPKFKPAFVWPPPQGPLLKGNHDDDNGTSGTTLASSTATSSNGVFSSAGGWALSLDVETGDSEKISRR